MFDHQDASNDAARFFSCMSALAAAMRSGDKNAAHEHLMEIGGMALHASSPMLRRRAAIEWERHGGNERLERRSLAGAERGLAMAVQYADADDQQEHLAVLQALAGAADNADVRNAADSALTQHNSRQTVRSVQRAARN